MRILTRNSVSKHQLGKSIAPLSARKELESNIKFERSNLKNKSIQDRGQVMRNLKQWEDTLNKSRPENLSPEAKSYLWKRAKQLKDQFTIGMLSTDELHPVSKIERNGAISVVVNESKMQNGNTVKRQVEWNKKMGGKVKEYKNIMRHLNPDNPAATDVEKFRPRGKIK